MSFLSLSQISTNLPQTTTAPTMNHTFWPPNSIPDKNREGTSTSRTFPSTSDPSQQKRGRNTHHNVQNKLLLDCGREEEGSKQAGFPDKPVRPYNWGRWCKHWSPEHGVNHLRAPVYSQLCRLFISHFSLPSFFLFCLCLPYQCPDQNTINTVSEWWLWAN